MACFADQRVAVLETIGDSSFSIKEKQYITDKIRERAVSLLNPTQGFIIMTRENILVMLPPDKAIEECEGTCIVETGRNIATDYVCQAKIDRIWGQYTVNIELYETRSGKLIGSLTQRAQTIDNLLNVIENESDRLFKAIAPQNKKNSSLSEKVPSNENKEKMIPNTVKDSQGNVYKTVTIGTQTWTAENMRTIADNSLCYDNNPENCKKYGRLYQWYDAQGVCPAGWHLPSKADFNVLMENVGGATNLKSTEGWTGFMRAGCAGLNSSKFSALPAGYNMGTFLELGKEAYFWTSSIREDGYSWFVSLDCKKANIKSSPSTHHMSVRCVKNQ